ncbi:MAG: PIN domain-containing protein [Candidatus Bathyarchaeia archaeon]
MKSEPARKTIRVILDSNALFVPIQLKIDIFQELKTLLNRNFELVLLKPIQQELERLVKEGSPQTRKKALYALKLAEKCRIVDVKEDAASPDDIIFQTASRWSCPVFTNDSELREKLRNINVPVIYVRQKSRLEIDGRL